MRKLITYCILLLTVNLALPYQVYAQPTIVKVDDGKLIITINQKSQEYTNLLMYFGLNEDSLFKYKNIGHLAQEGWTLERISKRKAIITKEIMNENTDIQWGNQPLFFNFNMNENEQPGYPGMVKYGINNFVAAPTVFENHDDVTVFYLPFYSNSSQVYLSGNFNDWSTGTTPMQKTDSGWIAMVKLKPGKYFYKFIVDGKWIYDSNNNLKEADGQGSYNSTYYHYNFTFKLSGFQDKKQIILSGNFNNWNEKELKMKETSTGWELGMYLKEGTHDYKFIADNQWMLDPGNPIARPDGMGNTNSIVSLGNPTTFELNGHQDAKVVVLTGTFSDWNTSALIMEKTASGWQLPFVLAAGNYEYKFIVDGNWIVDPKNPSTIQIGQTQNSIKVISANKVFELHNFPNAKEVYITGSFIGWAEPGYKMIKVEDVWIFPCFLAAGKYTYKFIVDGQWILDPGNNNIEENEFSNGNSVIWISPETEFIDK